MNEPVTSNVESAPAVAVQRVVRPTPYALPTEEKCSDIEWAESVIMAVEVGMFNGTQGEYATALLVKAAHDKAQSV